MQGATTTIFNSHKSIELFNRRVQLIDPNVNIYYKVVSFSFLISFIFKQQIFKKILASLNNFFRLVLTKHSGMELLAIFKTLVAEMCLVITRQLCQLL